MAAPSTRLQLSLRAKSLPPRPGLPGLRRRVDPFAVVVSLGSHPQLGDASVLGRTEVIRSDHDPSWTSLLIIDDFVLGRSLYLEVGVFDHRDGPPPPGNGSSAKAAGGTGDDGRDGYDGDGAAADLNDLHASLEGEAMRLEAEATFGASFGGGPGAAEAAAAVSERTGGALDDEIRRCALSRDGARGTVRRLSDRHSLIGSATFEVGTILGKRSNCACKSLGRNRGIVFAHVERSKRPADRGLGTIYFRIRAMRLRNTYPDLLNSKSSPFYEISRREDKAQGAEWNNIYRSRAMRQSLDPYWDPVEMDLERFCNGDLDCSMRVRVFDKRKSGRHRLMGEFETTVKQFVKSRGRTQSDLERAFVLRKDGTAAGRIVVAEARIIPPRGGGGGESSGDGTGGEQAAAAGAGAGAGAIAGGSTSPPSASRPAPPASRRRETAPDEDPRGARPNGGGPRGAQPNGAPPPPSSSSSGDGGGGAGAAPSRPPPQSRDDGDGGDAGPMTLSAAQLAFPPPRPQFVDYLSGGCELCLCLAIDFTSSNGDPRVPGTPHYVGPPPGGGGAAAAENDGRPRNDYEAAIVSVGSVLAKFDSDQMFPVWGFGALFGGRVRHCFRCGPNAEVRGVGGMLAAYRSVFRSPLVMSHPTVLTDVIRSAARDAHRRMDLAQGEGRLSYTVLLILTVGNVSDVRRTQLQLREAGRSPLSVVIVGIGDASFDEMRFLDEFGEGSESGLGVRDITQFVKFNDHRGEPHRLAEAVLEEIPDQLVDYFLERGVMPPASPPPPPSPPAAAVAVAHPGGERTWC